MALNENILWVINPNAGSGDHDFIIKQIKKYHNDFLYETTGNSDDIRIKEILNERSPSMVICGGGDGTIKEVASLLKNSDVSLGILPLGSANGLAAELDISENINSLIHSYKHGDYVQQPLDAIQINDQTCFHIADAGLNAKIVKGFENQNIRGFTGYALGAMEELNSEDLRFTVKIDDQSIDTLMVIFANARKFGTGVTINPKGKIDDGVFEVGILKNINPLLVANLLFKPDSLPDREWFEIKSYEEILLKFKSAVDLQIDGEYIGQTSKVYAKILPSYVNLMIPTMKG